MVSPTIMRGFEIVSDGIVVGVAYALMSLGLALLYGIFRIINFAHGEFYMLGAYLAYGLITTAHISYPITLLLVLLIGGGLGGMTNLLIFNPLRNRSRIETLVASLGLSILLSNAVTVFLGATPKFLRIPGTERVSLLPNLSVQRAIVFASAVLLISSVWAFLSFSLHGKALRALAENPEASSLVGISPRLFQTITWIIATALACLSGALLAPVWIISPSMGTLLGLKAFAIVMVGGFGNISGPITVAVLVGIAESVVSNVVSGSYQDALIFSILICVVLIRPRGLVREIEMRAS